jgi:hypothetical protein
MKKNQIIIAASALLLTVGAFITSKAKAGTKKSTSPSAFFKTAGSGTFTVFTGASSNLTTTSNGKTARIISQGIARTLFASSSLSKPLYFK